MNNTDNILLDLMKNLETRPSVDLNSIKKKVLVLSTPRSGSSLFCDVLTNTGMLGECREWFNNRYLAAYGKLTGNPQVQFNEYLQFIMEKTVGNTGVFAVNAHIEHMMFFAQRKVSLLDLGFDVVVFVKRKNKLAQAVSLAKSNITDSWSSETDNTEFDLEKVTPSIIVNSLKHIVDSEAHYEEFLSRFVKVAFDYEDFCQLNNTTAYSQVLSLLELNYEGRFETTLKKQSNNSSKQIIEQFNNYLAGNI
ncbi:Stf0 family sulfotransferase [Thalassotalea sediminis]|uniref:Stf0 family sulfotransferase n=1 Tax=Thalassotalea sediminis TaxID=1759089 RepID=UPI0025744C64|nr:Stf0 family sulfotransferase [Thalassotalea sediminis]